MSTTAAPPSDPLERCVRRFPCTNSPPPCIGKCHCLWHPCEANAGCVKLGRCGRDVDAAKRKRLMYLAVACTTISLLFSAIALCAFDPTFDVIKNTCWTKGTITVNGTVTESYIGLRAIALRTIPAKGSSTVQVIDWEQADCATFVQDGACRACKTAVLDIGTPAIMAIVTIIPQLTTDLVRSLPDQDVRCQKAFGIITGLFGLLSTLQSLNAFGYSCRRSLNDIDGQTWEIGPGLTLSFVAAVLKTVDVAIHGYVTVPRTPPAHQRLRPPTKKNKETKDKQMVQVVT